MSVLETNSTKRTNLQRPNVFYRFLPDHEEIKKHASNEFEEIKKNISICVQAEEVLPGLLYWSRRLMSFINLHGYFFTKEDHLKLIHLYISLLDSPFIDFAFFKLHFELLTLLLRKKELISRTDLVIQWRPLKKLYDFLFSDKDDSYGLLRYSTGTLDTFVEFVRCARCYFSPEAADEIFKCYMHRMCPFDSEMRNAVVGLSAFLPVTTPVDDIDSLKPWITNLMDLWIAIYGTLQFDSYMISIFSRFAYMYAGYIDWSPWMSAVFTRICRSFRFSPLAAAKSSIIGSTYTCTRVTTWIVYMMNSSTKCLYYLRVMFKSFKPFYYTSSFNKTQRSLQSFVERLCGAFTGRLHRERIKEKPLDNAIPEHYRLKESDIDEFVDIVKDYVLTTVLMRQSHVELSKIVHCLASLRPGLIIPNLIDRFLYSLEIPTEPQRFLYSISALAAIPDLLARHLPDYPKSRLCLIRIMKCILVGLDVNDQKRLWATLHLYFLIFQFTSITDFSNIVNEKPDLNDDEIEFCNASAELKDIVIDVLERIFQVTLNLTHDSTHVSGGHELSDEETEIRDFIQFVMYWLLQNCSIETFELIRDKIIDFISNNCFTSVNTAILAGALVNGMVSARPREVSTILIPKALTLIKKAMDNADEKTFAFGDPVLAWNIRLLSECMVTGAHVCPYVDEIVDIIKTVTMRYDRNINIVAASCLKRLVAALCRIVPVDDRLVNHSPERGLDGRPAFDNWGHLTSLENLQLKFYEFSEEEVDAFIRIVDNFLYPELDRLYNDIDNLTKDQRIFSARAIKSVVTGGSFAFPRYNSPLIPNVIASNVPHGSAKVVADIGKRKNHPSTTEARIRITDTILAVVDKLAVIAPDDVITMKTCLKILGEVATNFGYHRYEVNQQMKVCGEIRSIHSAKLLGLKLDFRNNHILRARAEYARRYLYEDFMLMEKDVEILLKLFHFSTSHYSEVRKEAQSQLAMLLSCFRLSSPVLTDKLCDLLNNSSAITHDELKGCLFVLLELSSPFNAGFYLWPSIERIWPTVAALQQVEKRSAQNLIDKVFDKIKKSYATALLYCELNKASFTCATELWQAVDVTSFSVTKQMMNGTNTRAYLSSVSQLASVFKNTEMKWKSQLIAVKFLALLSHRQYPMPSEVAVAAVEAYSHENDEFRKIGQDILLGILRLKKHKAEKVLMSTQEICGQNVCLTPSPGSRPDNNWLQVNLTVSEKESYASPFFLDKTFWGYYMWPSDVEVSLRVRERCIRNCSDDCALIIYEKFTDTNFVAKVLDLNRVGGETKRKFCASNFKLYKALFRNYGPVLLPSFMPSLKCLIADKSKTQEKSLVCVAEIIAGMLRGSKDWSYEEIEQFWTDLKPVLETVFNSLSSDSEEYFINSFNCAMEDIDPRRNMFLIRALIYFLNRFSDSSSFLQAVSVSFMQCTVQLEWRGSSLWRYLFDMLKLKLSHPYKNVRSKVSELIAFIVSYDIALPPSFNPYDGVSVKELMSFITERCFHSCKIIKSHPVRFGFDENGTVSEEYKSAINFIDSVLIILTLFVKASLQPVRAEIIDSIPMLCELCNVVSFDNTLSASLKNLRLHMSCCYMKLDTLTICLDHIENVLKSSGSWHARKMALSFLQLTIFTNLANAVSLADRVTNIFLGCLQDEKYEVKMKAVQSLSELVHCGYVQNPESLASSFINQVKQYSSRRTQQRTASEKSATAGSILGLCAITLGSPHEIPSYLPAVLINLCNHMNTFNSTQATVKRTLLEFRRTHQYNWEEHKTKFSEDELLTLTDALISPNYYA